MLLRLAALLVVTLLMIGLPFSDTLAQGKGPFTVEIEAGDITLACRYFPADGADPAAAVLLLHGWNWPDNDPSAGLVSVAEAFQRAGFTALVPSMRGWPPSGGSDDCAGRQVNDVLQSLEWLGRQPAVDPDKLFLAGFSQGGQIALLAATRGAPVRAVAAFSPVVDPGSWGEQTNIDGIRDYVMEECGGPPGWRSRSVLRAAGTLVQPLLLVHGDADRRVPTQQSIKLYQELTAAQRPAQLRLIAGAEHDQDAVFQPQLAIDFFMNNIGDDQPQK
jgi:dipeptidyl aminopeptidase/acylaminoacyl peptidase